MLWILIEDMLMLLLPSYPELALSEEGEQGELITIVLNSMKTYLKLRPLTNKSKGSFNNTILALFDQFNRNSCSIQFVQVADSHLSEIRHACEL